MTIQLIPLPHLFDLYYFFIRAQISRKWALSMKKLRTFTSIDTLEAKGVQEKTHPSQEHQRILLCAMDEVL